MYLLRVRITVLAAYKGLNSHYTPTRFGSQVDSESHGRGRIWRHRANAESRIS